MLKKELELVKTYLKKHLNKRFIIEFSAPFTSSILFAKKSNDDLKFCVNYQKLNKIIKKNQYSFF